VFTSQDASVQQATRSSAQSALHDFNPFADQPQFGYGSQVRLRDTANSFLHLGFVFRVSFQLKICSFIVVENKLNYTAL